MENEIKKIDPIANINNSMNNIISMWNIPSQQVQAINKSATIVNSKHGLFSGVPIVCKGDDCPYKETCTVDVQNRIVGSRCPQEIGALLVRFEQLCEEFKIQEEDSVDLGQVKELVDLEIMILRCDSRMAVSADILQKSIKDISKTGKTLFEFVVDPAAEFKLKLIERHSKLLADLNGTRASKKETLSGNDASSQASSLIEKAKELDDKLLNMDVIEIEEILNENNEYEEIATVNPEDSPKENNHN